MNATQLRRNPTRLWIVVIPLLLLACLLGMRTLDAHAFWGDEVDSVRDARGFSDQPRTMSEIWNEVADVIPDHPPGYFMLLNLWGRLTGWQPPILRFLSLLAGLMGIAWTYRLGRQWFSPGVGLMAAAILSVSPFYIFFFTQARVYSITALLAVFTVWVYFRILDSHRLPAWWWWLTLFGCVVVTLYTYYLASLALAGIALYHLVIAPKNRHWWMVTLAGIAGAAMFVPWVQILLKSLDRTSRNDFLQTHALNAIQATLQFVWMFSNGLGILMVALLVVVVIAGRSSAQQAQRTRRIMVISGAALAALLVINQVMPLLAPERLRYMLSMWPLFAVVLAIGVLALGHWRFLMFSVAGLWMIGGLWGSLFGNLTGSLDGAEMRFPVDQIAAALKPRVETGDLVLNYLPDGMSYLTGDAFEYYYRLLSHLPIEYSVANRRNTPEAQANLEDRLWKTFAGKRRIWIVYPRDDVPSGLADIEAKTVKHQFQRCAFVTDAPRAGIDLYVAAGVSCPPSAPSES